MSTLYKQERVLLLSKVKELAFFGLFLLTALLAMAGWVYFLSSIIVRSMLWCFS